MKRHVTIFAFLLCAFAVLDAAAANYLKLYSQFDGEPFNFKSVNYPTTKTNFTAEARNGWEISEWWAGSGLSPSQVKKELLQTGGETCEWDPTRLSTRDALCEVFKPITYDLSFNAGGGSGSMTTMSDVCYTNVFNLPKCDYTRTGWRFTGWRNSLNGATFSDMATVSGEILSISNANPQATLTALWENLTFIVMLDRAGGSGGATSVNAICGEALPKLTSLPTRAGYDFVGYFEAPDGAGDQYYDDKGEGLRVWPVKGTGTLYAKWNAKVGAIGYEKDGGDFPSGSEQEKVVTWTYDQAIDVASPQKDQFVFDGWKVTEGIKGLQCWYSADDWATSNRVTTESQVCKPSDGKLSFVNFNADGGKVILAAVWSGQKKLTVKAVPEKGGTVTGGGSYDKGSQVGISATPNDGYSFIRWADDETAPAMRTVTVENDVTYTALFTGKVYQVYFDAMGGKSESESRDYRFGEPFGALPQASKDDYSFSGWFSKRSGGTQYTAETPFEIADPDENELTMYAHWTLIPSYHVAFVGGLDASGSMDVQKIYRDRETALTSNAFERTGYTFRGWAETNDLGRVKYTDGTNVLNIAAADATNELHAVWSANHYTVAFDGNGATEVAMDPQPFTYGKPQNLPPNTYTRGELWSFIGWSNEVDGIVFTDGALVSNLCTTAGGTNTLRAVWRSNLTDLSRAMHCDNLIWIDQDTDWAPMTTGATAVARYQFLTGFNLTSYMAATGTTCGTLSFHWQASESGVVLELRDTDRRNAIGSWTFSGSAEGQQDSVFVELPEDRDFQVMNFRIYFSSEEDAHAIVNIDQMTWTPAGGEPKQGEPVAATAVGVENGVFSLTIPTESGKDYGVWTNADLTVDSWGLMGNPQKGDGNPWKVDWTILPGFPQLFFRAHKVEYK
ncbi:MAG: InlB B-repeat-containing protein [bacterium]|nr:InlB B-repeat-containing protein [Candidatus Colisoma equi]